MRTIEEDRIYRTQIRLSLDSDILNTIDRFQEEFEEEGKTKENGKAYSKSEILEILLTTSPMFKDKLDKLRSYKRVF